MVGENKLKPQGPAKTATQINKPRACQLLLEEWVLSTATYSRGLGEGLSGIDRRNGQEAYR